jgi:hypothetical protein
VVVVVVVFFKTEENMANGMINEKMERFAVNRRVTQGH